MHFTGISKNNKYLEKQRINKKQGKIYGMIDDTTDLPAHI